MFVGKFFNFDVIGFDLGSYHGAIGNGILRLDRSDWLRIASGASNQGNAKHRHNAKITHAPPNYLEALSVST